tara:strand:- start:54 stop:518 length:465 start_codon:yes stop_codon:yes gene_type:complete
MAGIVGLTEIQHQNSTSAATVDASGNLTIKTGTTTVQGEGTATTNLQQGLAKQFCHLNMSTASVDDSFNNSSITDSNTGNFRYAYTNNMANLGYTIALQTLYVQAWGNVCNIPTDSGNTTTQTSGGGIYSVNLHTNGNATDTTEGHVSVTGDLA